MFRNLIITVGLVLLVHGVFAQRVLTGGQGAEGGGEGEEDASRVGSSILNDTTASIYGPTTAEYFYASSIADNENKTYSIDTSVYNLHKFSFVDLNNHRYQDLGTVGTAIRPVYFQFPQNIGRTTGYNVYEPYFRDASQIKFYNTQSPYSKIGVVIGGEGRSLTEAEYNRNIDYRSNIGFSYHGMFIDEQVERESRGDRNVEGVYYNIHGNYHTINNKYHIMASFIRKTHEVDEYGGIRNGTPQTAYSKYFADTIQVSLNNTRNRELRRQYYVYHEYHLTDVIEIFHELQHNDQLMRLYTETDGDPELQFLPGMILTPSEIENMADTTMVRDKNKYESWSNKFGLSGSVGGSFYKVYLQRRQITFDYSYLNFDSLSFDSQQNENMGGVMVRIGDDFQQQLYGQLDYLEGGYYNFEGRVAYKPFFVTVRQMKRKPSVMEAAYRGSFNEWSIDPDDPVNTEYAGGINILNEKLILNASLVYQRHKNYVYFTKNDTTRTTARQNNGTITAFMPQVQVSKWWGDHWLTAAEFVYSKVGGDEPESYPLPELFGYFQVSYNNISFDGNLEWQLGVEANWKSSYLAPGYDPLIQHYYVQNDFMTPEAPVIDVFLNAKINRGRLFLKYINLFHAFGNYGYMPTPYYPGQVSTFDFGFNWSFYD